MTKKTSQNIWRIQIFCITFAAFFRAESTEGRFVYRLGRKILNLKRGVRFPYRLHSTILCQPRQSIVFFNTCTSLPKEEKIAGDCRQLENFSYLCLLKMRRLTEGVLPLPHTPSTSPVYGIKIFLTEQNE